MRRRPLIPPRLPCFLGCEGESEFGYGAFIHRLIGDRRLPIALHLQRLQPGAGDPLALVERAVRTVAEIERRRERFALKAVLIDRGAADKSEQAARRVSHAGLTVIWQDPDHEALLLRHLPGCQQLRPPRGHSLAALQVRWPEYRKGMTATQLSQRISIDAVRQAMLVEPELRMFLAAIVFE